MPVVVFFLAGGGNLNCYLRMTVSGIRIAKLKGVGENIRRVS
jgi:hypothetical protein